MIKPLICSWGSIHEEDSMELIRLLNMLINSPVEAKKWLINLYNDVQRLEMFPESARIVPEINDPKIREIIFKNFRIIYEIKDACINILTVRRFSQLLDIDDIK